ncbi:putative Fe-S cluster-containing radical SAM superfamily protein [Pseudomonas oryzihabitans]
MGEDEVSFSAWIRTSDIQTSIRKCEELFNCGIFSPGNVSGPLFEPAIVSLLIRLSDLLRKSDADGMRISASDHMECTEKIRDVTDLVRECRNAACHVGSGEHLFESVGKFTFNVVSGYSPKSFMLGDIELGCDFHDDMAIFYGAKRIYLRRHLLSAFEAVRKNYPDH